MQAYELCSVLTRDEDCWFLLLWTTVILLATIVRMWSLSPSPLVTHCTYGRQNRHERQFPNSTFRLFNLYRYGSVFSDLTGSITPFHLHFKIHSALFSEKTVWQERGLDKSDWSPRDVFKGVSKYIDVSLLVWIESPPNYWMSLTVGIVLVRDPKTFWSFATVQVPQNF